MKKHSEKVTSFESDKDRFKSFLDSFSRSLSWFVGQTAYKLIKVKKEEEKKEKEEGAANAKEEIEKMHELIIQSNLLSGGIENRNIHLFSTES
jgi:DNA-binding transcriptional regulator GbsR (MarR family)